MGYICTALPFRYVVCSLGRQEKFPLLSDDASDESYFAAIENDTQVLCLCSLVMHYCKALLSLQGLI